MKLDRAVILLNIKEPKPAFSNRRYLQVELFPLVNNSTGGYRSFRGNTIQYNNLFTFPVFWHS